MSDRSLDRRTVLRASGLAAVGGLTALAGCSGGGGGGGDDTATAESTPTETASPTEPTDTGGSSGSASFDGWLEGVSNYDGVVDRTGRSEVTVEVGVQANGGYYGFGPAAVRVSSGTTVTWEWTGQGASHNVVAQDGTYESELVAEAGHTFTHTFESTGTSKYYCMPHKALGMKGVVVVE
ncbi:halocyanin domain-containing protein [Halobaculum gomorrense]|uniref:Halocyanin domain-containing protein n=2 Tax=Halobaculum gomorrense TaxID=43928 RepID=A0A1M5NN07_9EURY|nr:halocyanin domain-containing protein [Halobaculum gomorrense]SHG90835.1 halocyanin domain-containing protein [Halobaculum gomorrense]